MQIDLTTFILELINFAVLVWILNHFLYKPVQGIMARRRAKIEKMVQEAEAQKAEAGLLRDQYESRVRNWEREQATAHAALTKELAVTRENGLDDVRQAVEKEKQRLEVAEAKKQADRQREIERRALTQAVAFAGKFLQRLADPELDIKLAEVLIQDIETWPAEKIETLAKAVAEREGEITVTSARALTPSVQKSLEKKLSVKLGQKCKMNFSVDDTLITGLRLTVGPWVLQANAKDELAFFAGKPEHDN
ncbi:MAG: hypothetical protein COB49_12920 [Alphaproteobacteria bacterium]|nr:MAG: hypothetical protein COB49_12920 [Alphaproteobacteria bacterium]